MGTTQALAEWAQQMADVVQLTGDATGGERRGDAEKLPRVLAAHPMSD